MQILECTWQRRQFDSIVIFQFYLSQKITLGNCCTASKVCIGSACWIMFNALIAGLPKSALRRPLMTYINCCVSNWALWRVPLNWPYMSKGCWLGPLNTRCVGCKGPFGCWQYSSSEMTVTSAPVSILNCRGQLFAVSVIVHGWEFSESVSEYIIPKKLSPLWYSLSMSTSPTCLFDLHKAL